MWDEFGCHLVLDKAIKGSETTIKLTFYVNWENDEQTEGDSQLTTIEIPGKPKLDGLEKQMELQPIKKKGERVWVTGKGTFTGEDDDENEVTVAVVQKIVFKTMASGEMAWMQLGEKGENVVATQNWKD